MFEAPDDRFVLSTVGWEPRYAVVGKDLKVTVYAGLAGFYVITDPGHEPAGLPSGPYDIGLAIQDGMLTTDGQLW